MSSALTEAAAGPAGKEGPGGGEGHFLHRKRLGPSEASGQEELGLSGQLQGLHVAGEVKGGERGEGPCMKVWCLSLDFTPGFLKGMRRN